MHLESGCSLEPRAFNPLLSLRNDSPTGSAPDRLTLAGAQGRPGKCVPFDHVSTGDLKRWIFFQMDALRRRRGEMSGGGVFLFSRTPAFDAPQDLRNLGAQTRRK